MKTIIVATDFSKEAENAVEYAAAAASQIKARLVLFNSFSLPMHASNTLFPASRIQDLVDDNQELLKKRAEELSVIYPIQVDYESSMLHVIDELYGLIYKYEADVVVMGMASKSLEQDLLGNTTTSAIQQLKFPVIAVPLGARFGGIKRILFACDVLRGVHKRILERVREAAQQFNAEVEVLHVSNTIASLKENADHLSPVSAIDEGLEGVTYYFKNVQSNTVIRAIEREIKHIEADLLIMVPNKYGFWSSLIHRSKTRTMASRSEIPLLSIPV